MKNTKKFLYLLLVLFLCSGCGQKEKNDVVKLYRNNQVFTVDKENQTITSGEDVYHYQYTYDNVCRITYPNGGEYWWQSTSNDLGTFGTGGWNDSYDAQTYVDGSVLMDVIDSAVPKKTPRGFQKYGLVILLFAITGIWNIASPYTAWYLSHGWKYKDAEPSDLALELIRLGGIVLIIIAVFLCFT